ncbi:MAG: hypothetical protein HC837_15435 [Chloroflexaceae bacterium]|nr:hypothetical protein [Chloroflexaceae bacterium]
MAVGQGVSAHAALARPTTLVEQGRVLAQRLIRWYLRWWINPIVEQQNAFNAAATQTVQHLVTADAELRAATAALRARRAGG